MPKSASQFTLWTFQAISLARVRHTIPSLKCITAQWYVDSSQLVQGYLQFSNSRRPLKKSSWIQSATFTPSNREEIVTRFIPHIDSLETYGTPLVVAKVTPEPTSVSEVLNSTDPIPRPVVETPVPKPFPFSEDETPTRFNSITIGGVLISFAHRDWSDIKALFRLKQKEIDYKRLLPDDDENYPILPQTHHYYNPLGPKDQLSPKSD